MYKLKVRIDGVTDISRANDLEGALALLPYYLGAFEVRITQTWPRSAIQVFAWSKYHDNKFVLITVDAEVRNA